MEKDFSKLERTVTVSSPPASKQQRAQAPRAEARRRRSSSAVFCLQKKPRFGGAFRF
jgi:hypothetical protein